MPGKKIHSAELGRFFRELRERRGLGLRQAVTVAQNGKLREVTLNTLGDLERGSTKHADPELLRDVAKLYQMPYGALVAGYTALKFGIPESDLSARADPSHAKKSDDVTSPDSGAGVQDTHTRGGSHAVGSSVSSSRVLADRQAALLDGIVGAAAEFFDLADRLRKFGDMSGELTEHAGKLLKLAGADDPADGTARDRQNLSQRHGPTRRQNPAGSRHFKRASR